MVSKVFHQYLILRSRATARSSALRIRRRIFELNLPENTLLIFDRKGIRETFWHPITHPVLSPRLSIYTLLTRNCSTQDSGDFSCTSFLRNSSIKSVGIFPGSRVPSKTVPKNLIESVVHECLSLGLTPTVFVLDGESQDLESVSLSSLSIVPRCFDSMKDAVCSMDAVISADSMPAHMAEYYGRPVFVLTPVRNDYWLPLSCFNTGRWMLFNEFTSVSSKLKVFLSTC